MSATLPSRVGAAIRGEFPIFETATYLNSCSQGALSHGVRAAVEQWLSGWDANGAEWDFWVERNEEFRASVSRVLHAEADDVAVTTSVSQGVSALVSALPLDAGRNRIVISEYEFPTIGQIAHAQELRGAEVVHVRPDADGGDLARALRGGDRRADGARLLHDGVLPLGPPARRRRDRRGRARRGRARAGGQLSGLRRGGARRAARSAPTSSRAAPSSTCSGRPASGSCGSGPRSTSALVPTQTGWFADEDIFAMSIADYSPHRSARRFDSGTPPVPALYAGVAGAAIVEEVGVAAIEAHVAALVDRLLAGLDELGGDVATPRDPARRGPLVCVRSTDVDALVAALAAEAIVVSQREDKLRVALHLYNVEDDVDRLARRADPPPRAARLTTPP